MDNFSTGSVSGAVEKVCKDYASAIDQNLYKLAIVNLAWIWFYPLIKFWFGKGVNLIFGGFKIHKNIVAVLDSICYASILIANNFIIYAYVSQHNVNVLLFLNSIKGYLILIIIVLFGLNYYFNNKEAIHKKFNKEMDKLEDEEKQK